MTKETKICIKCKQRKLIFEFYKDKRRPCGLQSECKECVKNRSKKHNQRPEVKARQKIKGKEYYEINKFKIIKASKEWADKNKEKVLLYKRHYQERNKEKIKQKSKEYGKRPEVKERVNKYYREYRKHPERKLWVREYRQRPEIKIREKLARQRIQKLPEFRRKRKEYRQRPEVKIQEKTYKKKKRKDESINLEDQYVKHLIQKQYHLKFLQIPKRCIEQKRDFLLFYRQLKKYQKEVRYEST